MNKNIVILSNNPPYALLLDIDTAPAPPDIKISTAVKKEYPAKYFKRRLPLNLSPRSTTAIIVNAADIPDKTMCRVPWRVEGAPLGSCVKTSIKSPSIPMAPIIKTAALNFLPLISGSL